MLRKKKGQSTLEYIILVTGVIVVLLAFLGGVNSPFGVKYNDALTLGTDGMYDMANRLRHSRLTINQICAL